MYVDQAVRDLIQQYRDDAAMLKAPEERLYNWAVAAASAPAPADDESLLPSWEEEAAWRPSGPYADEELAERPSDCLLTDVLRILHKERLNPSDVDHVRFEGQSTGELFWCTFDEFAAAARGRAYTLSGLNDGLCFVGRDAAWQLCVECDEDVLDAWDMYRWRLTRRQERPLRHCGACVPIRQSRRRRSF